MKHDFIDNGLTAFIADLDRKLVPYGEILGQKFPVAIKNTGDESFLTNQYKDNPKQFYNKIPRMSMQSGGFEVLTDQLTKPRNFGRLMDQNSMTGIKAAKRTNLRRIPLQTVFAAEAVFENMMQYFKFIEIVLSTSFRINRYSFYHAGYIQIGEYTYTNSYNGEPNLGLGHDTEKREIKMPMTFELNLQMPAYDYYNSESMLDASNTMQELIHRTDTTTDPVEEIHVPQRNVD